MFEILPLTKIKANPNNPRLVKDDKFKKLVKSIQDFPQMLNIRPIVVNEDMIVLGGNMRLKACKEAGLKEVPVIKASSLTEEQQREFIIKDNVGYGEWDWDVIANEWDEKELIQWGVDIPCFDTQTEKEGVEENELNKWTPDCLFPSDNIYDIPTLLPDLQGTVVHNPVKPYGADSRDKKGVGTYHFYVDDYRFESIWDTPNKVINSECLTVIEPNLSLFNTTPISYGLHLIFKKRWISRYFQSAGISVFVDLNVNSKFSEYNLLGVPEGWKSFATRGYADRMEDLEQEYQIANKISGGNPTFIIYGGGKKTKDFSAKHNCIYIEQFKNTDYGKK
jgi:hypothetical protein